MAPFICFWHLIVFVAPRCIPSYSSALSIWDICSLKDFCCSWCVGKVLSVEYHITYLYFCGLLLLNCWITVSLNMEWWKYGRCFIFHVWINGFNIIYVIVVIFVCICTMLCIFLYYAWMDIIIDSDRRPYALGWNEIKIKLWKWIVIVGPMLVTWVTELLEYIPLGCLVLLWQGINPCTRLNT